MFKIALVGCGRIAKRHSELLGGNQIAGACLSAVCDVSEEKAKVIGDNFGVYGFANRSNAGYNYGIYGSVNGSSATNYGVYGYAVSGINYAVFGRAGSTTENYAGY